MRMEGIVFFDWPIVIGSFIGSLSLTPLIRYYALKRRLVDIPNARSSHDLPTPRGGGLSIAVTFMLGITVLTFRGWISLDLAIAIAGGGLIVAVVGFWDDHKQVPAKWRIVAHFIAAGFALYWMGGVLQLDSVSPLWQWIWNIIGMISLVWLLNLYNFMDGIDAFAGAEALFVSAASAMFLCMSGEYGLAWIAGVVFAAVGGFLLWNLPPARIFMGDVGSGFLGIVFGILAIAGSKHGVLPVYIWVILLGVFIVDTGVTLVRRVMRGARWYESHRCHAYQHAALQYNHHGRVTLVITALNLFWLLPWAIAAWRWPGYGALFCVISLAPLVWLAFRLDAGKESFSKRNTQGVGIAKSS